MVAFGIAEPDPGEQQVFVVVHPIDPSAVPVEHRIKRIRRGQQFTPPDQAFAIAAGIVQQHLVPVGRPDAMELG